MVLNKRIGKIKPITIIVSVLILIVVGVIGYFIVTNQLPQILDSAAGKLKADKCDGKCSSCQDCVGGRCMYNYSKAGCAKNKDTNTNTNTNTPAQVVAGQACCKDKYYTVNTCKAKDKGVGTVVYKTLYSCKRTPNTIVTLSGKFTTSYGDSACKSSGGANSLKYTTSVECR